MGDIQRWDMFGEVGINEPVKYAMLEAVEGGYVTYADHVAALLTQDQQHMEQQAAAEQDARRDGYSQAMKDTFGDLSIEEFVAAAEQRGIQKALIAWQETDPIQRAEDFARGVQAARDAVDAVWSAPDGLLRGLCNHADALAAIDALKGVSE